MRVCDWVWTSRRLSLRSVDRERWFDEARSGYSMKSLRSTYLISVSSKFAAGFKLS